MLITLLYFNINAVQYDYAMSKSHHFFMTLMPSNNYLDTLQSKKEMDCNLLEEHSLNARSKLLFKWQGFYKYEDEKEMIYIFSYSWTTTLPGQ